ncbi:MAG: phosphoadenylyl-sulfate reductase [Candidatus Omnitrophica bacterium]|nr:phosphoadenylyl-sulfate reductase [Candidatus Omnitrophota bacterium]
MTKRQWTKEQIKKITGEMETKEAREILKWASDQFAPRLGIASSFGLEDVVLIDLLCSIDPKKRFILFTLDTGRLHEETYEVMERIRQKYGIQIKTYFPDATAVEKLEREKGLYSFRESVANRKECCGIRKVESLKRALRELDAWVTGLRREQGVTRTDIPKIEYDETGKGLVKLNPIADWTSERVWSYIREKEVPYNKLHDQGFPSIGCSPCTRAVKPGEDIRAGRWWWENPEHKECGLHVKPAPGR